MIEINLLPQKTVLSQKERQLQRVLIIFGAILTVVVVGFFLGLVFWQRQIRTALTAKEAQQRRVLEALAEKEPEAKMLLATQAKLAAIEVVRPRQLDFGKRAEFIFSLPVSPESIKAMDWPNGSSVRASLVLSNPTDTEALLAKLGDPSAVPALGKIVVEGLQGSNNRQFSLNLSASYKDLDL